MRHNKCAVFQVTNNHGYARLICVTGIKFSDGAKFEAELRRVYGEWLHVTFLGRFDQIEIAPDLAQAFDLLVPRPAACRTLQSAILRQA
jgi:hypothetical protein